MANRAATTRKSRLQNTIAGPGGGGGVYGVGGATVDGVKGTRVGGEGGRIVRYCIVSRCPQLLQLPYDHFELRNGYRPQLA